MRYVVVFISLVTLFSCSTSKKVLKMDKNKASFSLEKGSCLGKCSVYNLHIYPDKVAVFEGIANTELYGIYYKNLSVEDYNALTKAFNDADFMSLKDDYYSDIIDFPLIKLGFTKDKVRKVISGKNDRPKALLDLQLKLEDVVYSKGWQMAKAYEQVVTPVEETNVEHKAPQEEIIENQIIIEPNPNTFLAKWIKKYSDFNVSLVKKIAPNLNLWVITYNNTKISPKDFLETLRLDPDLKSAEFNRKITPREH
ncbi:MAG: hypothetical protein H6567_13380 [Lewinellaceae bacterium]|nr:hypothetical protein [Lewinellaceae bacterium]